MTSRPRRKWRQRRRPLRRPRWIRRRRRLRKRWRPPPRLQQRPRLSHRRRWLLRMKSRPPPQPLQKRCVSHRRPPRRTRLELPPPPLQSRRCSRPPPPPRKKSRPQLQQPRAPRWNHRLPSQRSQRLRDQSPPPPRRPPPPRPCLPRRQCLQSPPRRSPSYKQAEQYLHKRIQPPTFFFFFFFRQGLNFYSIPAHQVTGAPATVSRSRLFASLSSFPFFLSTGGFHPFFSQHGLCLSRFLLFAEQPESNKIMSAQC
mmetsp:Transcript_15628/g.33738  ORF Transcript_15628/g.33738 Transcript_15628/m.33738 type:complete len:256 (+) Transcript_15628:1175-1942(+)